MSSILLWLYVLIVLLMTCQSLFNLRLRLFIWQDPARRDLNKSPTGFDAPRTSFTVLLPARHEVAVIADTIERVCRANYPPELLQVLVICESGDGETIAEVQRKLAEPGKENARLIVFDDRPINKPHALNKGLAQAVGDVVTIFDAEDEPHADIFQIVNTTMIRESVEVVQGGVHLVNFESRWFSPLNVLEYFFWFTSSLHYFGWADMVPLGGNTVFIRRELLLSIGGWDEHCLTEDADLGVRLSVAGAHVRILCDDEYVTREETPPTVAALIRQRTRWSQGFMQVLLKGDWRFLPTWQQRVLAAYVLTVPFIQAMFALVLPISIVMIVFIKLPVWLAMLTFAPLYVFCLQACIDIAGLAEFIHLQGQHMTWRLLLTTTVGFFPYQWLLAFASARAVVRLTQGQANWEKTLHTGVHRKVLEPA